MKEVKHGDSEIFPAPLKFSSKRRATENHARQPQQEKDHGNFRDVPRDCTGVTASFTNCRAPLKNLRHQQPPRERFTSAAGVLPAARSSIPEDVKRETPGTTTIVSRIPSAASLFFPPFEGNRGDP